MALVINYHTAVFNACAGWVIENNVFCINVLLQNTNLVVILFQKVSTHTTIRAPFTCSSILISPTHACNDQTSIIDAATK